MRKLISTLALLVCSVIVFANPVSLEMAKTVGSKFMAANVHRNNDLQLVSTYRADSGTPLFYVFNTSYGFVIVSADDCASPILGYSGEGQFDVNNVPEQMEAYFQGFIEQIQYGIENHVVADEEVSRQWEMVQQDGRLNDNRNATAVNPLLTDTWNQDCYYNDLCPVDNQGPCGHVYAGCTGTAMGQIMHFWSYPETGNGSTSYTPSGYPMQSANFGATTYQWSQMPDALYYSSSQEQRTAVATLLWHCGVALHCAYGPNGTGAAPVDVPVALVNYFRFASDLNGQWKSNNTTWLAQVKDCLDQGRPLHYSAWTANNEGHSFVCDGYDNNDKLHFNWGWSGSGNGYFNLTALNVNGYQFNSAHYAVFNIHPLSGESYTVTTSANPSNGGTTSGDGVYQEGQSCTVHAVANSGFVFDAWTENGEQVSTSSNYSFNVYSDRTLVAVFTEIPHFTIATSANPSNGGNTTGDGTYQQGQTCTVHATANTGYTFTNWTENGTQVSTNANYAFAVNADRDLVANFTQNTYTISSSSNPSNGGTTSGGGTFHYGEVCTLVATPAEGFDFVNWTKNGSHVSAQASYTFVVNANGAYVAHFTAKSYQVTANSANEDMGVATGGGTFTHGQTCVLTATPNDHFDFVCWSEDGEMVSEVNPYIFDVTSNRTLLANFEFTDYEISALCNPADGGVITGTGTYHYGEEVTLNVEPNTYFFFESWTEDGDTISVEPQITFVVEGNRNLVANLYYFDAVNDNANASLKVYPNPASDVVIIEGAVSEVKIFNTLGQLVISEKNSVQQRMSIDISRLEAGVYTLMAETAEGIVQRQIVKR